MMPAGERSRKPGGRFFLRRVRSPVPLAIFAACLFLYFPAGVHSAENDLSGRLRIEAPSMNRIWVGQRIPFFIDLLSPTVFSGAPVFDLPEVPGAVLFKLPGRPTVSSETLEGTTYSVQRHEFALFPQRAGTVTVPPFSVRFGVAEDFTSKTVVEQRMTTEGLRFEVTAPPGTENLAPLVSTRSLTVEERWEPAPESAEVGDAFTRTVTLVSPGFPGMALPPVPATEIPGMGVYPKPARVNDRAERGDLVGERIDTVTYVCEAPGRVTLPRVVYHWWDTEAETLQTVELHAVTLTVAAAPEGAGSGAAGRSIPRGVDGPWFWGIGALLLAAGLGWRFRKPVVDRWRRFCRQREGSEPAFFRRFLSACRRNHAAAAFNALMQWLGRVEPTGETATIERFTQRFEDPSLAEELVSLQRAVVDRVDDWNGSGLARQMKAHRRRIARGNAKRAATSLPPLNPF